MSSEFNPHNILEDVIISNIYIIIPFIKKYRDVTTRIETEKLFFNFFFMIRTKQLLGMHIVIVL